MFQIIQEILGGEDAVGVLLLWVGAAIPAMFCEWVFLRNVFRFRDRVERILWSSLAIPAHLSVALLLYPVKAKDVPDWFGWIVSLFVINLGLVGTQRLVMKQMR